MKVVNIVLFLMLLVVGVSAVGGGIGLIQNGAGLPIVWLEGSPFQSFIIPGVLLLFVIGGTHILAAIVQWKKYAYASEVAAIAGFGLVIWIFTELYLLTHTHWLQVLYFSAAILTLILVTLQMRNHQFYGKSTTKKVI